MAIKDKRCQSQTCSFTDGRTRCKHSIGTSQQLRRASFSQSQLRHPQPRPNSSASFSADALELPAPHAPSAAAAMALAPADTRAGGPVGVAVEKAAAAATTPLPARLDTDPDIVPLARKRGWRLRNASSSSYRGSASASCLTSSTGSPTPVPVFSIPVFTVCGKRIAGEMTRDSPVLLDAVPLFSAPAFAMGDKSTVLPPSAVCGKRSAGEMTRNSPLLMSSAMTIADTSVGGPEAHTCLAPKNRPAQAPQGARLRVGCTPWVVLMRMDLAIPMLPRMVMDVGGKMAMRVGTSGRAGTVIGREGKVEMEVRQHCPMFPYPPSPALAPRPAGPCTRTLGPLLTRRARVNGAPPVPLPLSMRTSGSGSTSGSLTPSAWEWRGAERGSYGR
ncbi:hypothetical protein C8R44DRAFT_752904 [Mycena epipterygia]|nr:hypothetical protein C8R44DRAFT_752904 [Mycena epipterygia]